MGQLSRYSDYCLKMIQYLHGFLVNVSDNIGVSRTKTFYLI